MTHPPLIAITMGDPAGIGPEIIVRAAAALRPRVESGAMRLAVLGDAAAHRAAAAALGLPDPFEAPPEGASPARWPLWPLIDVGPRRAEIAPGVVQAEAGRFAYEAVARAVRLAMAGDVAAIVTAPLNKEALNLAGHAYAGHTEMLAELTGARDSVMMLAHGAFRVTHVTTHTALKDVPGKITPGRLRRVATLTEDALRRLGVAAPRIAVAALNPHAGEGGLFGREDIDITAPTVAALRAEGMDIVGPLPGDTIFVNLRAGRFDAVMAMYHDQGHIPVKLLGFDVDPETGAWRGLSGVNVTLGLPIIRTSVDHGTAFDIAGKGVASEQSLVEAVAFAADLAGAGPAAAPAA